MNGAAPPIAEAQGANGSMRRRPGMPAKSSVLCVTSGRRWVSAVAAMMASPSLRRLSWRRRIASATISSVSGNVSTVAKKPAKAAKAEKPVSKKAKVETKVVAEKKAVKTAVKAGKKADKAAKPKKKA